MVGVVECLMITTAAGLGEEAYGAAIREEIESTTVRKCSIGALDQSIDGGTQRMKLSTTLVLVVTRMMMPWPAGETVRN